MPENLAARGTYTFLPLEKVIFGTGTVDQVAAEADRLQRERALVVTGRSLATTTTLIKSVEAALGARYGGTYAGIQQHVPESGIADAVRLARDTEVDLLVSVGGGSPIDAAKAVARRLAGEGGEYLPHIAIPTTLSAAEFSHLAGYTDEATRSKTGFADPRATPRVVILDPEMTLPTPMWLWLASGVRALDHAVETLYKSRVSPGERRACRPGHSWSVRIPPALASETGASGGAAGVPVSGLDEFLRASQHPARVKPQPGAADRGDLWRAPRDHLLHHPPARHAGQGRDGGEPARADGTGPRSGSQ